MTIDDTQTLITAARTDLGRLTRGDATEFLRGLPAGSVDLVITSPWFTGPYTFDAAEPASGRFGDWITGYAREFERVLAPGGSVVLELGATWATDRPVRTVQHYAAIARLLQEENWFLLQEFYWYNPDLLTPRPDLVEHGHTRLHDCVSTWFWLARTPEVPVDTRRVTAFQNALTHPFGNFLAPGEHPLDLDYLEGRTGDRVEHCATTAAQPDADRYPVSLPLYFITLLTGPDGTVVDPFAGIGSTAIAAEVTGRTWRCNDFSPSAVEVAARRIKALEANR